MKDVPGKRWPIFLGLAGFAAGFFGPMIFVPDANQGPMVGIFISGPAGVALGFVLYAFCSLLKVTAQNQWRLLLGTLVVGVLATLLGVQPSPALQGTILEAEVMSCSSPRAVEAETLKYWDARIAEVTWSPPREGWRQDMRATLQEAPGAVVAVRVLRENSVFEDRKPWNHGTLFASGWVAKAEEKSFYGAEESCDEYPSGRRFKAFESHDLNGKIEPPIVWPPTDAAQAINASSFSAVPERFKALQ
ncbi:MAG TPA: hypothetical protein VGO61_14415 [Steroidobacteraceae bacterium]|jgi:hypothetical protein|nr:hypothetical protein [Steroidobacteraceae bacterium]